MRVRNRKGSYKERGKRANELAPPTRDVKGCLELSLDAVTSREAVASPSPLSAATIECLRGA